MQESKFSIAFPAIIGVLGTLLGVGGGIYSTTLSSAMEVDRQRVINCIARIDKREEIVRDRVEKLLVSLGGVDPDFSGRDVFTQKEVARMAEKIVPASLALAAYVGADFSVVVLDLGSGFQMMVQAKSQGEADQEMKTIKKSSKELGLTQGHFS